MHRAKEIALIIGVIILGFSLILGPFGIPGDAAGLALIVPAAGGLLKHGK